MKFRALVVAEEDAAFEEERSTPINSSSSADVVSEVERITGSTVNFAFDCTGSFGQPVAR